MSDYDVNEILSDYDLPDLPDAAPDGDPDARILILFRQDDTNIVLTRPVPFADANEYANHDDTHGDGWFVGRDKTGYPYTPGEVY